MNTTTTTRPITAEKKMIVGTKRNRVQENVQETFKSLKTTMTPEMIDLMNRGISPSFAFLITTSMKKTRKNHRRL